MAIRYSYIRYVIEMLEEDLLNSEAISEMCSEDHTMTDAQLSDRLSCLNDVNETHFLVMPSARGEVVSESPQTSSNHPSTDSDSSYSVSDNSNSDSDSSTSDSDSSTSDSTTSTSDSDHPTPKVRAVNKNRRNVPPNRPPQRKPYNNNNKRRPRGGPHTIPPMSLEMYRHVKEKSKIYIDPRFMILLDACNIAMFHGGDHFSTKGICIARDYFKALGLKVLAIIPGYYVNRMDGRIVND